jgi:serine/threonine-protein kinase
MTRFGRYELARQIAAGGMAQVYEGLAHGEGGFTRRVAIKRVLPELADDESQRRMLLDEVRISSHLYHANIVQILDFGFVEDSEFIVLEYVDGTDGERALRMADALERPVPPTVALHIVTEVALALDYAHGLKAHDGHPLDIVHRDVSLANVLLSWEGDVKLSDFGIALASTRQEQTAAGVVKGKLNYMAPEQAKAKDVSSAADVFALGAVMYVLIAGDSPRRMGLATPSATDLANAMPPRVAELADRCLREDPTHRPSAAEVASLSVTLRSQATTVAGRTELKNWLAPFRRHSRKADAFDEALAAYLVRDSEEIGSFTLSRSNPGTEVLPAPEVAEEHQPEAAEDHKSELHSSWMNTGSRVLSDGSPPSGSARATDGGEDEESTHDGRPLLARIRWAKALGLLLGALTALAAGFLAYRATATNRHPTETHIATPDRPDPLGPEQPGQVTLPLAASTAPDAAPDAGAAAQAVDGSAEAQIATKTKRRRSGHRRPNQRPQPAETQTGPEVTERGWIRVGGPMLRRAAVELDGRLIGHAPLEREVPVGDHQLVVRALNSRQVLLEHQISVAAHHRRAAPLRVIR